MIGGARMDDARGPLPAWCSPATWIMSQAYRLGVAARNRRFDRGSGVQRLGGVAAGTPVLSVGNLTAGGTGKSPFVAWTCGVLRESGVQPVVALRGYRSSAAIGSDEAREYEVSAPDARVVVGARRREALEEEFAAPASAAWRSRAVVVLDDGFQHRQLSRDLDIVLVDATRPALDGALLPLGWLREPAANISRAGIVVLTKAGDPLQRSRADAMVERWRGRAADASCEHAWRGLRVHEGGSSRTGTVDELRGRRALSVCALGNPGHFHAMVARATGLEVIPLEKGDHRRFAADEIESAARSGRADIVVTSMKDLVKFERMPRLTVAVPSLGLEFISGEGAVRAAISGAAIRASSS